MTILTGEAQLRLVWSKLPPRQQIQAVREEIYLKTVQPSVRKQLDEWLASLRAKLTR
jgi:hypothetical protein